VKEVQPTPLKNNGTNGRKRRKREEAKGGKKKGGETFCESLKTKNPPKPAQESHPKLNQIFLQPSGRTRPVRLTKTKDLKQKKNRSKGVVVGAEKNWTEEQYEQGPSRKPWELNNSETRKQKGSPKTKTHMGGGVEKTTQCFAPASTKKIDLFPAPE